MSERMPTTLDQVLFFLYVRLVDEGQAIGLRDIELLDRLLAKPKLLEAPVLESAIKALGSNYQKYWRSYQEKRFAQGNNELHPLLSDLYQHQNAIPWTELKQALQAFIRFFAVKKGLVAKLRSQQDHQQHRLALAANLSNLLNAWAPNSTEGTHEQASLSTAAKTIEQYQHQLHRLLRDASSAEQNLAYASKGTHRLICTHVHEENSQVKTFTFIAEDLRAWAYLPGQFMTFEIPQADGVLRRSYSISSSPYQPYSIEVTVKQLPQGKASNWFHQHVKPGKVITAHGPHGNFSVLGSKDGEVKSNEVKPKIALFAAGVGITPIMSMLRYLIQSKQPCDVVLVNRVHSHADLIFAKSIGSIHANTDQNIKQITISSDAKGDWPTSLGLNTNDSARSMSPEAIQKMIPDILGREVYLCGPDSFKDSVLASLSFLNFDTRHFHSESFGGINQRTSHLLQGEHAQSVNAMVGGYLKHLDQDIAPEDECFVEFKKSGKTVRCAKGDLLIEIAEFNGIAINNSCRSGSCGTCKCRVFEGSVSMDCEDGLTPTDLVSGDVLTCVGHVNSKKVVIDA